MVDAIFYSERLAEYRSTILREMELSPGGYLVATVHRAENTDIEDNLREILSALCDLGERVVFPVHPRTQRAIERLNVSIPSGVQCIPPVSYFDMLMLVKYARLLLTDSGGLQKEAFLLRTPCLTLRNETEWIETVRVGWNRLTGADRDRIVEAVAHFRPPLDYPEGLYGDGRAGERIVGILESASRQSGKAANQQIGKSATSTL